jgi:hypothetical protein
VVSDDCITFQVISEPFPGSATQASPGSYVCAAGPPLSLSPNSSTVMGPSARTTVTSTLPSSHGVGSTARTEPSSLPTAASSLSSNNKQIGSMVGGIVGGVVVVAVLVVLGLRKRHIRLRKQME